MLLGVHNITQEEQERKVSIDSGLTTDSSVTLRSKTSQTSREQRRKKHVSLNPTTLQNILPESQQPDRLNAVEGGIFGGIPARNKKGEKLCLYLGLIDILQCYKSRFSQVTFEAIFLVTSRGG